MNRRKRRLKPLSKKEAFRQVYRPIIVDTSKQSFIIHFEIGPTSISAGSSKGQKPSNKL